MSKEQPAPSIEIRHPRLQGSLEGLNQHVAVDVEGLQDVADRVGAVLPADLNEVHVGIFDPDANPIFQVQKLPSRRGHYPDASIGEPGHPNLPAYLPGQGHPAITRATLESAGREAIAQALHRHPEYHPDVKKENVRTRLTARLGGFSVACGLAASLAGTLTQEIPIERGGYGLFAAGLAAITYAYNKEPKKRVMPDVGDTRPPLVLRDNKPDQEA